jgi:hypothetical protein
MTDHLRTERFIMRLTREEKRLIEHTAWEDHLDMSTWARHLLLKEVERRAARKRDR